MSKKCSIFVLCLILFINIFSSMNVFAQEITESNCKIDIHDNADFFTNDEEEALENYINSLCYNELEMDVVVLTELFDPKEEVRYTDDFYDENGYGPDGILFFVSENVFYVNTSGYSIVSISDYEIEQILNAGQSGFDDYDFYDCVHSMIGKAAQYIDTAYNNGYVDDEIDTNIIPAAPHKPNLQPEEPFAKKLLTATIPTLGSIFVSIIITAIVAIALVIKHKGISKATNAKEYLAQNSYQVTNKYERYIGSRETVQKDFYKPSSSSSGGSSSRSSNSGHRSGSSHRSSSGRSHGGGGRRR
jgi:uncharacterized protein